MDISRLDLHLTGTLLGAKATVSGAVGGRVLGAYVDPSTHRVEQTVITNRLASQNNLTPVNETSPGSLLLDQNTTVFVGKKRLGNLTRLWVDHASGTITHILFRAHGNEHVVMADQISQLATRQLMLRLSVKEADTLPLFRDDADIAADVDSALDATVLDPRARRDIHVRVEDGQVDLSGIVDARDWLETIQSAVETIPGVRGVHMDIIVTEGIATMVTRELDALRAKGALGENADINVLSEHQIVYLQGRVATAKVSADAERAALGVNGVRIVVNNLHVATPEKTVRADPESPATHNR